MNILIITYDFSPDNMPNTFKWHNISKEFIKNGHNVIVLSSKKNKFNKYEVLDGIKIYRTGVFLDRLRYKSDGNRIPLASESSTKGKIFDFKKTLKKIYDNSWAKLYWPDHSCLWYLNSRKKAKKLIDENNISHVISVSWTFSSHLLGLYLKRRFNNLFWIADTVDPFSLINNQNNAFLYKRLNYRIENLIFKKSDHNTILTDFIKKTYIDRFNIFESKLTVINNLFVPTASVLDKKIDYSLKESFELSFIGTLNSVVRSPEYLLSFIDEFILKNPDIFLKVSFYGNISDCDVYFLKYPNLINKVVFLKGMISKLEVERIISESDVLINIGNKNPYQEPSKLIEYIYYNKKIINFYSIKDDSSKHMLKDYPFKLNVNSDWRENDSIRNFRDFLNSNLDSNFDRRSLINKYSLETITSKYLNILEQDATDKK